MIKVGVIGATGYVGIEIIRILADHPGMEVSVAVSQSYAGRNLSEIYPSFSRVFDIRCSSLDMDEVAGKADIFVTALPHGVSKEVIPGLAARGLRVLDHSGDFRYKSAAVYEEWYKTRHEMPELLEKSVYGLPELYRDSIRTASIVGNPGCYPTCSILGLAPLLKHGAIDTGSIIIDAVSGVSGAGRKSELEYQFCELDENIKAYNVGRHRHTSEIEQEYSLLAGKNVTVTFTPHLAPIKRGMLCTIYAELSDKNISTQHLLDIYNDFYKDEYFVRILVEGKVPETKNTAGSNFIDIGLATDKRTGRVIVLSALDNLGKGAAGQAVQDLNIMCGMPEKTGLERPGYYL